MPNADELMLAAQVGRVDRPHNTTLSHRSDAFEIDGDSLPLVRAVLDALVRPRGRADIVAACAGFDADQVGDALEFLTQRGFVVAVPTASAVWTAALQGVQVVGHGAVAAAVARAVEGRIGKPVDVAAQLSAPLPGGVVISVSSTLIDPCALRTDRLCRHAGALHVPVLIDGTTAHVGPLVAPTVDSGPCARCAWMRLMAMRHENLFLLYREAVDDPTVAVASDRDEGFAAVVAPHVLAFLRTVTDSGRWGDKERALMRVTAAGIADAHRVKRHSHCPVCAVRPPQLAALPPDALAEGAARTVATWQAHLFDTREGLPPAREIVDDITDPVTGLMSLAEEWTQREGYFRHFPVLWGGVNIVREREWVSTELQGINGTGPTVDHRRLVCVSEGTERYAQYAHRPDVTHATFAAVREHAVDPREVVLYTDDRYASPRFPRQPFDEHKPLWWSWGYGLVSKRARLMPTEMVAVSVTDESYPERLVDQRLTSGAASHTSWQRALLNSMRELVERDALMLAWYKRIPLPEVRLPERIGDAYADDLLSFIRSVGLELRVLDLRLDFPIPTYLLVGRLKEKRGSWDAGGTVFVSVGDLDPVAALSRGLCEMALHYETLCLTPSALKDWRMNLYDPHDPAQGWRGWWPTYMHYLNPANVGVTRFLASDTLRVDLGSLRSYASGTPARDVETFVQLFAERQMEPWAFDLVNEEVAELGFRVAKVVVPGLIDLTPGMQSRRLRSPRLEQIAQRMGRPCLPPGELNPDPHPNA